MGDGRPMPAMSGIVVGRCDQLFMSVSRSASTFARVCFVPSLNSATFSRVCFVSSLDLARSASRELTRGLMDFACSANEEQRFRAVHWLHAAARHQSGCQARLSLCQYNKMPSSHKRATSNRKTPNSANNRTQLTVVLRRQVVISRRAIF